MEITPDMRQQRRASAAYRRAVRKGELIRGAACESCGALGRMSGHHWHGYDDAHALDVQWLCRPCHNRAHTARLGGLAGGPAFVATVSLEQRREVGRRGGRARAATQTPEQRTALARSGGLALAAKSTAADRAAMGRKGGIATMARMTPGQRSEFGRKAVQARWARKRLADAEGANEGPR